MTRGTRIGVMVVVPTLAVAEESDNHIVAAGFVGVVGAVAPQMGHRIDRPGNVPHQHGADEDAPDQHTEAKLQRLNCTAATKQFGEDPARKENAPGDHYEPEPPKLSLKSGIEGIAQNILRIQLKDAKPREFSILNHKPSHMRPQKMDQWAMRIRLPVRVLVMQPMVGNPTPRSVLETAHTKNGERVLQPFRAHHATMGQQPMKAQADSERAENIQAEERYHDAGPAEEPGHERE